MEDLRCPINQVRVYEGTYYASFGRQFKTEAEAEKYRQAVITRREALAGRQLTETELRNGRAEHFREMSASDRSNFANFSPVKTPKPKLHPFDDPQFYEHRGKKDSRKAADQRAREDYDARMALQKLPAFEKPTADEELALQIWEHGAFSPDATPGQFVLAHRVLVQQKHDPEAFRKLVDEYDQVSGARNDELRAAATLERDKAQARIDTIKHPYQKPEFAGLAPGDKVSRVRDLDGNQFVRVVNGNVIKKEWPAAEAPAEYQQTGELN